MSATGARRCSVIVEILYFSRNRAVEKVSGGDTIEGTHGSLRCGIVIYLILSLASWVPKSS
jgi:hypothetical protein